MPPLIYEAFVNYRNPRNVEGVCNGAYNDQLLCKLCIRTNLCTHTTL